MRHPVPATLLLAALALGAAIRPTPASAQTWLFDAGHILPSTDTGWGNLAIEPESPGVAPRLFVPRHADGLLVWNPASSKATTIDGSTGANAIILAPPTGRGYSAMADGSVLTFDLKSLKPLGRIDTGMGALRTGFYEPTQDRVYLLTATGTEKSPDKTTWITLDAPTGQVLGKTEFNSRTMDTPATDGRGAIFAPMRDKALLQELEAKDLSIRKTWKLGDCQQPAAVLWDGDADRVLIACRGDKPVFVALNRATGIVATIPIGRGVDGLALDPKRHLVVTSNGLDGTLTVIRQDTPDSYALVETTTTRPTARGVTFDEATGQLLTASAVVTRPAPGPDGKPPAPIFHPNSFSILSYKPH